MDQTETLDAVTAVVRDYVEGMMAGDRARIERAFYPGFIEVGHFEGELLWNSRDAFIAMCEEAAADAPHAKPAWVIRGFTVAGDIAFVHVEDDWAGLRFDDFLTLLRDDGQWRIVSKAFHVRV